MKIPATVLELLPADGDRNSHVEANGRILANFMLMREHAKRRKKDQLRNLLLSVLRETLLASKIKLLLR